MGFNDLRYDLPSLNVMNNFNEQSLQNIDKTFQHMDDNDSVQIFSQQD